jgi:predicted TIM-barrel fold metal-dependent hydrolase
VTPYAGPVIDAHHHLWPPDPALIPWLDADLVAAGTPAAHARTFPLPFAATIWIEGVATDPIAELAAAEATRRATQGRLCTGLVAHAPLDAADLADRLDRLAAVSSALRGVRDIVAPLPVARAPDLMDRPAFAAGLAQLARRGLAFDLMLRPAQMAQAADLLARLPSLRVALEHAGAPHDTSPAGMALWRQGIARLARHPGVIVKVSALQCLDPNWTDTDLAALLADLRAAFGASRMAMGTDWPVHDRHCPAHVALGTFRRLVADWPSADQRAFFHDTAARFYRLPDTGRS